jgi:hypothetical protein
VNLVNLVLLYYLSPLETLETLYYLSPLETLETLYYLSPLETLLNLEHQYQVHRWNILVKILKIPILHHLNFLFEYRLID